MTLTILSQVAVILLLILVGWALSKGGKLPDERALVVFLLNVSLPATILNSTQVPLSTELLVNIGLIMLGFAVVLACGFAAGFLAGALTRQRAAVTATWAASAAFPNAIFIGWPFKYAVYGDAALPLIPGIALVFNVVCFTFASWLLSLEGTNRSRPSVKKLLMQPVILSCLVGAVLLLAPVSLPGWFRPERHRDALLDHYPFGYGDSRQSALQMRPARRILG